MWNYKTGAELASYDQFGTDADSSNATINDVIVLPRRGDEFALCTRSKSLYIVNQGGQVVKSFSPDAKDKTDFLACCPSPRGEFLYGLADNNKLYCFRIESGELEHSFEVGWAYGLCLQARH